MKDFESYGSRVEFSLGNSAWDYGEDEPSFAWFNCSIKDLDADKVGTGVFDEETLNLHWREVVGEILEAYAEDKNIKINFALGKSDYEFNTAHNRMVFSTLVYFD